MRLNWTGYQYRPFDGYGRYGAYMIHALLKAGVEVTHLIEEELVMPAWMQARKGYNLRDLTISCLPPYYLVKAQGMGRRWLLTMTEGGALPQGWARHINEAGIERVIVPCEHNAQVFRAGGVQCPVSVIPGGTDPDDFPLITERPQRPYTFLALADRGNRKGWMEVYTAFYLAFGGITTGAQDVKLIIKCRPGGNEFIDLLLSHGDGLDPRIVFDTSDVQTMRDLYAQADCVALPSRSEGWGMPHREAAMCGLPVIVQRHSGLDDGHTDEWAIVLAKGQMQEVEDKGKHVAGEWMVADIDELAGKMRKCYEYPHVARDIGFDAASWLRANQTWDHAAAKLLQLLQQEGVLEPERVYA